MDVLASGPERPARDGLGRWLRDVRRRLGASPHAGPGAGPPARPGDGPSAGAGDGSGDGPPAERGDGRTDRPGDQDEDGPGGGDRYVPGIGRGEVPSGAPGGVSVGARASGQRRRRRAAAAVAVLAAAGAVAALRAGAEPVPPRAEPVEPPAHRPSREYRVLSPPPYDRLPGRTPIPAPRLVGPDWQIVRGRLPAVGEPGRPAAQRAAALVIGRYCREPAVLAAGVTPDRGWTWVTARVFSMERSNSAPVATFRLIWTRGSYDWIGSYGELLSC